jgi:lysozyme
MVNTETPLPYPQLASQLGYTKALHEQLRQDEGSRLLCYQCTADKATIGVGHNLQANSLPVDAEAIWKANPDQKQAFDNGKEDCWTGLVITAEQEQTLLEYDIQQFENKLQEHLTWYSSLPANPRCSLTNMCFNLGWAGLSKFVNMLAALEAGDYEMAANEALDSNWAKQVGARSYRVTEQMRTPESRN